MGRQHVFFILAFIFSIAEAQLSPRAITVPRAKVATAIRFPSTFNYNPFTSFAMLATPGTGLTTYQASPLWTAPALVGGTVSSSAQQATPQLQRIDLPRAPRVTSDQIPKPPKISGPSTQGRLPRQVVAQEEQEIKQPPFRERTRPSNGVASITGKPWESRCIGEPGDPLKVIYFHGLYPNGSESAIIETLRKEAAEKHIRIALPMSPNHYSWNYGHPRDALAYAEKKAQAVCGQPLDPEMALYGFSNGGYLTRNVAKVECSRLSRYPVILVTGLPRGHMSYNADQSCRDKVVFIPDHRALSRRELQTATNRLSPSGREVASAAGRQ